MRRRAGTCLTGAVLVAVACDNQVQSTGPRLTGPDLAMLTGEAARQIEEYGQFHLAGPGTGELSEGQAVVLARAYVRSAGPWIGHTWEEDRGAPIDLDKLTACPRPYYTASPFEVASGAHASLRQAVGPYWLVSMCEPGGPPALSIAVSALATELSVSDGHVIGPGGGQFTSAGIPARLSGVPIAPEEAVRIAAEGTGRRVAHIPELVLAPSPYPPQLAKWRIHLEGPVKVRGAQTGATQNTSELYVGFAETWNWTGLQAGRHESTPRQVMNPGRDGATVLLVPRPGYPTTYERATVERP
jgi:hypothetical protein